MNQIPTDGLDQIRNNASLYWRGRAITALRNIGNAKVLEKLATEIEWFATQEAGKRKQRSVKRSKRLASHVDIEG